MSTIFFDSDTGDTLDVPDEFIINFGDSINPDHYKSDTMEAIDVMRAFCDPKEFRGHLRCNTLKYLLRLYKKDTPLENAKKARWYLDELIQELENED
jgi:hypothetical protein